MKDHLNPIKKVLDKRATVAFGYLFGSRAKGYANRRSDWDIGVYFSEPEEKIGTWPAFELEAELSRAVGGTVQVVVLNRPVSPLLGFEILKEGLLLIDRDRNLRMDFENRILRHYHDWQHFLKRQMKAEKDSASIVSKNQGG